MATRASLIDRVKREKLPTLAPAVPARLGEPDLVGLFGEALQQYSRARPRVVFADITGSGVFDLALPNGTLYSAAPAWVSGVSLVRSVEYPAGQREPAYLVEDAYALWPRTAETHLRLLFDTPTASETVRLLYTVPHSVTLSTDALTTPATDDDILVNLTARAACLALAGAVAEIKDATLTADAVTYRDLAQRYQALAKDFDRLLPEDLRIYGTTSAALTPASGWVDWDVPETIGDPSLWHGSRLR
jgi:hypothetical protein